MHARARAYTHTHTQAEFRSGQPKHAEFWGKTRDPVTTCGGGGGLG